MKLSTLEKKIKESFRSDSYWAVDILNRFLKDKKLINEFEEFLDEENSKEGLSWDDVEEDYLTNDKD